MNTTSLRLALAASLLAASHAIAQPPPDPAPVVAAQREAMASIAFMDGVWRGPAWTILPNGEKSELTQTERIGPFLQGAVKVIEGRGYREDGSVGFNAFGIISYDPGKRAWNLRSYALGHAGDFMFRPLPDGYVWEIPTGGGSLVRYTGTVKDGTMVEIGERLVPNRAPFKFFEMRLKRIGDSDWPGGGAVPMR